MIFYFSATGNNQYVAGRIAEAAGDTPLSITDCVRGGRYTHIIGEDEALGFVTPTYFWGLPTIVTDFLAKLSLEQSGRPYVYHVLTYGTSTGAAHAQMAKALSARGLPLDCRLTVRMVDTWTPMFDLSDAEQNRRLTEAAEPEIDAAIARIQARAVGDFNTTRMPAFLSPLLRVEYEGKRATKNFRLLQRCVGCGLCERVCPCAAIELREGRPVWVREKCTLCLGCLHRCPQFAIQYGKKTAGHGQFVHPKAKL